MGILVNPVAVLRSNLAEAVAVFRRYEALHRAKNTEDSLKKAEVNAELAGRFQKILDCTEGPWIPEGQGHHSAFGERFQVGDISKQVGGLTIRDYFAAHATTDDVQAVVNQHHENHTRTIKARTESGKAVERYRPLDRAEARYLWADQMLAARSKENVQA